MITKVGGETIVSPATRHAWSSLAELEDGRVIVVFGTNNDVTHLDDPGDVFGRFLDANGQPTGATFVINTGTTGQQGVPSVTAVAGGFVVVWEDGIDAPDRQIRVQKFDLDGDPVGPEFAANTKTTGNQQTPWVTALKDGGYVVVWLDPLYSDTYTAPNQIKGQVFDDAGQTVGAEFFVSAAAPGTYPWGFAQAQPTVTSLPDGGFAVAWSEQGTGADTFDTGVRARLFNADGSARGATVEVNSTGANYQGAPSVTALSDGSLIVVFIDLAPPYQEPSLKGRHLSATGTPIGAEFSLLETAVNGGLMTPSVVALDNGNFVVVWEGATATGIYAREYMPDGTGVGDTIKVSETGGTFVYAAATAIEGGFQVTWATSRSGSASDVLYTQRFSASGDDGPIDGTPEDDALNGTPNDDVINGLSGDDMLDGLASDDQLNGGAGDDVLIGGEGNDTLDGGDDIDTASYSGAASGVIVNLTVAGPQATGGAGTDTLISIENLIGSAFNDSLTGDTGANRLSGGDGNDVLNGGNGNDWLDGGAGNDRLLGGGGFDTVDYSGATGAVGVDLNDTAVQNTGGSGRDRLVNVENLVGSAFGDRFVGSGVANVLTDSLGGNDRLEGMGGNDTLSITRTAGAATLLRLDGGADDDTLGFQGGSRFLDTVTLIGGDGNDVITSVGSGATTIEAGIGNDTVTIDARGGVYTVFLGAGSDTLRLGSTEGAAAVATGSVVRDFQTGAGGDVLDLSAFLGGGGLTGYTAGSNPFASGHARLLASGQRTLLQVDRDGGGDGFITVLTFNGTTPANWTAYNLGGLSPTGSPAPALAADKDAPQTLPVLDAAAPEWTPSLQWGSADETGGLRHADWI